MTTACPVAIVGDNFMLPDLLADAISARCATECELAIRQLQLDWPDEPMVIRDKRYPQIAEFAGEPDKIVEFVGDAKVFVTHLAPLTAEMLAKLPDLQLVAVTRGGPVNIDAAAAKKRKVAVVNAPGRNAEAVAEFTVGAILAETRCIRAGHESLRAGQWRGDLYREDLTGTEMPGLTVGIVGYGRVGTLLARLLKPFEPRQVLAYDPYVTIGDQYAQQVETLEELLGASDVVVLNARVTEQTKNMISRERIAQMKRGALLVNAARGPLLDYDALHDALKGGQLGAAVLDTFMDEPPDLDWPLLQLPNVTLTPHIAGASKQTVRRAAQLVAEDIQLFLRGEELLRPAA